MIPKIHEADVIRQFVAAMVAHWPTPVETARSHGIRCTCGWEMTAAADEGDARSAHAVHLYHKVRDAHILTLPPSASAPTPVYWDAQ